MKEILRLPGEYQRSWIFDRARLLVGSSASIEGVLIALLFGALSCLAKLFYRRVLQLKAPRHQERIAIDDPAGASIAGSRGSASGERPGPLVSMIEEDGGRPGWTISQPAAREGNDKSELKLDRRSPIIAYPKMLISARESVSLHGSTEISSSDRTQGRDWSAGTQPSANLRGGNVSSFSHSPKTSWAVGEKISHPGPKVMRSAWTATSLRTTLTAISSHPGR